MIETQWIELKVSRDILYNPLIDVFSWFTVNCKWSDWGSWTKCSVSCGMNGHAGTRQRLRHIEIEGAHGGITCDCCAPKQVEECDHCVIRPDRNDTEKTTRTPKELSDHCIPFCPSTKIKHQNIIHVYFHTIVLDLTLCAKSRQPVFASQLSC